jgi:hypothetical protein
VPAADRLERHERGGDVGLRHLCRSSSKR